MPRAKNVDYQNDNTNELQYGGSCTAFSQANAMEISYKNLLKVEKINIAAKIFWQWREDFLKESVHSGGDFSDTAGKIQKFSEIFGGLPCKIDGKNGIIKPCFLHLWGPDVDTIWQRQHKLVSQLNRGYGVVFAIPVGAETFTAIDGFLKNSKPYTGAHAMCFEGYENLEFRDLTFYNKTKPTLAPEFYKVGNSWGETWGKNRDGLTFLKTEDFKMVKRDIATMLPVKEETLEKIFSEERMKKFQKELEKFPEDSLTRKFAKDFF